MGTSGTAPPNLMSALSIGLSAKGSLLRGEGEAAAYEYKAQSLERAAEVGKVAAVQTSADFTERINDTLGNIDAIRAAAHTDPSSPTGAAVRDYQEALGMRKRATAVSNILEQGAQDTADAGYLRTAGKYALLGSRLEAAGKIAKGLSPPGTG